MICPKCGVLVIENDSVCWKCKYQFTTNDKINDQNLNLNSNLYDEDSFRKTNVGNISIENKTIVTIGDWIVIFILLAIPIVNFIMPFIWAFSSSTPLSKKNFAKAILIIGVISLVIILLFESTFFSKMSSIKTTPI